VNIADFIESIDPFDLLVVLVLAALFILGFIQGTIRRLVGIASILFAFLLAANLREPLGNYLAANWTQFAPEYAVMIGFGTIFVAAVLALSLVIQSSYKKVPLFEKYTVVDEVLGGLLGVLQGLLLIGMMIIILDSFFRLPGIAPRPTELPFLRDLYSAYTESATANIFRFNLIPGFLAVVGLFIPQTLRELFPGR